MNVLEILGISKEYATAMNQRLNHLLSDYQIYYQNLRGLHWNIRGNDFFDLHIKFEEIYNGAAVNIDLIAERISALGETPLHTFEDYTNTATLPICKNVFEANEAVETVLNNSKHLLTSLRVILERSSDNNDEATNNLASDLISAIEKDVWMLNTWLK